MRDGRYLAGMSVTDTLQRETLAAAVERALHSPPGTVIHYDPGTPMTWEGFHEFEADYPEAMAELRADGTLDLFAPMILRSNKRETIISAALTSWWFSARVGEVYGPSVRFTLPDGSMRGPDAAWVSPERLAPLTPADFDTMARVVPDFVVEAMSKSDGLRRAKAEMERSWMAHGVRLAWLVQLDHARVLVYRAGATEPEVVDGFDAALSAGEVVPGFSLDLTLLR